MSEDHSTYRVLIGQGIAKVKCTRGNWFARNFFYLEMDLLECSTYHHHHMPEDRALPTLFNCSWKSLQLEKDLLTESYYTRGTTLVMDQLA